MLALGSSLPTQKKDSMNAQPKPIIVQPGNGQELNDFGNTLSVILAGEQTGGTLALALEVTPPGGGPPLHVHSHEDELFLVVEGRISYYTEGSWTEVGVGGAVYLPRGVVHSYRNVGTTPSRQWILTTPAGFEKFFAHSADEFAKPGGPEMNRIVEIHREHGIELLGEAPGRLEIRYRHLEIRRSLE
jgi:quercetin dioxygenase-like cupin family protein